MDKHYYLISQLPTLFYDRETSMTIELFLEEAEKWLRARDYRTLSGIELFDTSSDKMGPRLWRKYRKFETVFRNDLSLWRKSLREGKKVKSLSFPVSIVKEGNPLEVEKRLLEYRWNFLEEMEREHYFDLEFLIIYFLKLQILRRLSVFNKEKGKEIFEKVIASGVEDLEAENRSRDLDKEDRES